MFQLKRAEVGHCFQVITAYVSITNNFNINKRSLSHSCIVIISSKPYPNYLGWAMSVLLFHSPKIKNHVLYIPQSNIFFLYLFFFLDNNSKNFYCTRKNMNKTNWKKQPPNQETFKQNYTLKETEQQKTPSLARASAISLAFTSLFSILHSKSLLVLSFQSSLNL